MSVNVFKNNLLQRIAGKGVQDADFNANSRNGLQNRIITAWKVLVDGEIEKLNNDLNNIQNGESAVVTVQGNNYNDVSIDFSSVYQTAPNVVGIIKNTTADNASVWSNINMILKSVSTTGATFRVFNGSNVSVQLTVDWIAKY